jgi:hypothetical protein
MTQLEIRDIPAQSAAAEHATTSADELPAVVDRAFPAIFARLGELGEQPSGPFWESYVTNPAEEPDASKRVTEIYLPLR